MSNQQMEIETELEGEQVKVHQDEQTEQTHQTEENEQVNDKPTIELTCPFGTMQYRSDLKLTSASFMQLLVCYKYKVCEQKAEEGNKWQEYAYPKLADVFTELLNKVIHHINELLNEENIDKEIVIINLCGYKNFKLPVIVQTRSVNYKLKYENANARDIFLNILQRLTYLSTCSVPARYNDEIKVKTFSRVQELVKTLIETVVSQTRQEWSKICQEAGVHAGLVNNANKNVQKHNQHNQHNQYNQHHDQQQNEQNPNDHKPHRKVVVRNKGKNFKGFGFREQNKQNK